MRLQSHLLLALHARHGSPESCRRVIVNGVSLAITLTWSVLPAQAGVNTQAYPLRTTVSKQAASDVAAHWRTSGHLHTPKSARKADEQVTPRVVRQQCEGRDFAAHNSNSVSETLPELRTALADVYGTLLDCLHGSAKAQLIKDQTRWRIYHKHETQIRGNDINTYYSRLDWLRELLREAPMGPYPLVGVRVIIRHQGWIDADVHYPHFDNPGAVDAAVTNRLFARSARKLADNVGAGLHGIYYQGIRLSRPGPYLLDVWLSISRPGPMHPRRSAVNYLIDLHTDAIVLLSQVFAPHSHWRSRLRRIASADFKKRWARDSDLWYVLDDGSTPTYSFVSDGMGAGYNTHSPFGVIGVLIQYSQVQPLLRAGGPLAVALQERARRARSPIRSK